MKTMMLTGLRRLEMRETPDPVIKRDTDVLIRMGAVGVCGSDIHYYVHGKIGSQVVQYPFAVGHECAGTVEKVGSAVRRVKPGDSVVVEPAVSCGTCDQCRAGRAHTCRTIKFLGTPGQLEGCLSERIVMPESNCFPTKGRISLAEAALCEPLSIGLYSARLSVSMGKAAVAILGAGPIGLSVLLCARAMGCGRICVTDKIAPRLAAAGKAGAAATANPDTEDIVKRFLAREPLGFDAVFECCGDQQALDQGVQLLKPGGKLLVVGIPQAERVSFNIDTVRRREICIQNVRRQVDCVQPALDLVESGKVNAGQMITHRFPFSETARAFDLVAGYQDGVVKAVVEF